jgi:hypothetical protein
MANNKEGALELSIGTIVVIVIGMSMLILGLVLVRNIFSGSTNTVNDLNEQVQSEIRNLFGQSTGNIVVKLGSSNTAKVKPGDRFNVAIGAQHPDGESITSDTLQYKISLADDSNENCLRILGKERAEGLFVTRVNTWNKFDRFSGSNAYSLIEIDVPSGTARCTQKVNIEMKLKEEQQASSGDSFVLEVTREGLF